MKRPLKITFLLIALTISLILILSSVLYFLHQSGNIDATTLPVIKNIPVITDFLSDEDEEISEETEETEEEQEDLFSEEVTEWPEQVSSDFPEFTEGDIDTATEMAPNDRYEKAWIVVFQNVDDTYVENYLAELEEEGWDINDEVVTELWIINGATKGNKEISLMHRIDDNSLNVELISK
jgi:hypothetical protein